MNVQNFRGTILFKLNLPLKRELGKQIFCGSGTILIVDVLNSYGTMDVVTYGSYCFTCHGGRLHNKPRCHTKLK